MIIPTGYAHNVVLFDGSALPTGAAITFGVKNNLAASASDIAEAVWNILHDFDFTTLFANTARLIGVRTKLGPNSTGPSAEFLAVDTGSRAGDPGNASSSVLVKKNSALGGREGRGRFFIPAISESDIGTGGVLTGGFQGVVQSVVDDILTNLGSSDIPMYLLHNSGTTPTAVTALTVDARVANQRRRQRR